MNSENQTGTNPKKLALWRFFALVLAVSVPFWILGEVHTLQLLPGLPVSSLQTFTPGIAALILLYRFERGAGVKRMLRRVWDVRRVTKKRWWLAFVLFNPAVALLAWRVMDTAVGPAPDAGQMAAMLLPMLLFFLVGALGEEMGWSAYATTPMQRRFGTFAGGLFLGLFWAAWHYVPLLQTERSWEWIAWWTLNVVALRVIMTWLYVHTGKSLFAAALFHAFINVSWQFFPVQGSLYDPMVFACISWGAVFTFFALEWAAVRQRNRKQ